MKSIYVSRKIALFILSITLVSVLAYLGKDFNGVVGLYAIYCTGNVAQKFKSNNSIN